MSKSYVHNKSLGVKGEDLAANYLKSLGWGIVVVRQKVSYYELDIVCKKLNNYLFVEVKTVTKTSPISANELFTYAKSQKFIKAIQNYLRLNSLFVKWRADLICVTIDHEKHWLEHYRNVLSGY